MSTIQGAAQRLYSGSAIVTRRIGAWLIPEQRPVMATIRTIGTGWAGLHLLDLAHRSPAWAVGGACAWCIAAWRARPAKSTVEVEEEDDHQDGLVHTAEEIRAGLLQYLDTAIGTRNGVHLSEALAELQRQGIIRPETTVAEWRRVLTDWGIPTRSSLKVAGVVSPGVHRDDLQLPFSSPSPTPLSPKSGRR